jgi:hypothetical protein
MQEGHWVVPNRSNPVSLESSAPLETRAHPKRGGVEEKRTGRRENRDSTPQPVLMIDREVMRRLL